MQLTQQKVHDTGHRVLTFLDTQSAAIGTTVSAPFRAQLDTAVAQLGQAQVDQETLAKAGSAETAKQNAIRKEVSVGMAADFIAQMQAAVTQLTASVETRGKLVGLKQQTVKTLKESTKSIRDVIHIIDGNMRRTLKKNQPLLTNWVATKRIQATVVTPLPGGDLRTGEKSCDRRPWARGLGP